MLLSQKARRILLSEALSCNQFAEWKDHAFCWRSAHFQPKFLISYPQSTQQNCTALKCLTNEESVVGCAVIVVVVERYTKKGSCSPSTISDWYHADLNVSGSGFVVPIKTFWDRILGIAGRRDMSPRDERALFAVHLRNCLLRSTFITRIT